MTLVAMVGGSLLPIMLPLRWQYMLIWMHMLVALTELPVVEGMPQHAGGSAAMVVMVVGVVVATLVAVSSPDLVEVFAPLLGEIMMLATTQKMVAFRLAPVEN
ncbi:hypothetical protein PHYPSEUDO_003743 [Phytophthora pseudosyringae]|uniref:Uncharacterized protein n=1 Tax=Phytophthora pseudosyringae TaxID=221518 RepID=A0A8T1VTM0_9STRA|nr:hypothetical protein PHYPSEUDO_003743 [Phytophthora pseudosyringae]